MSRSVPKLALFLVLFLAGCPDDDKNKGDASPTVSGDASADAPVAGDAGARSEVGTVPVTVGGEECARQRCSGSISDLCCPTACDATNDTDCGGCGNGRKESDETCDPLETCPTACPQLKCEKRRIKSEGTCSAVCVSAGTQTECRSGDECCPEGCHSGNDRDCTSTCGNNVVETGELCDPLASCPQSCPALGCTLRRLENAGTCGARCVEAGQQTQCANGDGCCPSGCTAGNDDDCGITCGNGVKEGKETCDPLASCPTAASCKADGCRLKKLLNAGTCTAVCADDGLQTMCKNGDGCCPGNCHRNNDDDCASLCGNGQVETGETCDPVASCLEKEKACVSDANVLRTKEGDAGACTFRCKETPRTCGPKDGACPAGCGASQDADCPGCGNGIKEANETCDPCSQADVTACVSDDNTLRTPSGDPAMCTFVCTAAPRMCAGGDNLCPMGCTPAQDPDCKYPGGAVCKQDVECQSNRCVDGRCCVQTCGTCQSCTGAGGTCVAIAKGQEDTVPVRTCSGGPVCNGAGECVLPNGATCEVNGDCASNSCKDGVCCNETCTGACRTCNAEGARGTCTVVKGQDDPDTCWANDRKTCDANGTCVATACSLNPSPARHGFGSVRIGAESAVQTFTFTNACTSAIGPFAVALSGADANQFIIGQNTCNTSFDPGKACTVTVQFKPNVIGVKAATLSVQGTFASAAVSLAGTATSGAQLMFMPNPATIQTVTVPNSGNTTLTLVNTGVGASGRITLNLSSPVQTPQGTWELLRTSCIDTTDAGLAPQQSCAVSVRFTPSKNGPASFTLRADSTGLASASATINADAVYPPLLLTPTSQAYGSVFLNATLSRTFTLQNTSGTTLGAPQMGVLDPGTSMLSTQFAVESSTCPSEGTFAPGASCTINVGFKPTTTGAKSGTLRVVARTGVQAGFTTAAAIVIPTVSAEAYLSGNGVLRFTGPFVPIDPPILIR